MKMKNCSTKVNNKNSLMKRSIFRLYYFLKINLKLKKINRIIKQIHNNKQ